MRCLSALPQGVGTAGACATLNPGVAESPVVDGLEARSGASRRLPESSRRYCPLVRSQHLP
jgi:hypothetical protein